MEMRIKKAMMVSLCVILMLGVCLIAGCRGNTNSNAEEELQSYELKLYYVNDEYVATGNEELDQMMTPYEVTIKCRPEEVYAQAISKLRETPKEGYDTMVREGYKINSVTKIDDMVVVDFSSQDLSGGSMEEGFLVHQIVLTLLHSFDEIEKVQFTLDGQQTESLMGHVDVSKPFTLDSSKGEESIETVVVAE